MSVTVTKEMRHLIQDMIICEKNRYGARKNMSNEAAFRKAYDNWFRTVS